MDADTGRAGRLWEIEQIYRSRLPELCRVARAEVAAAMSALSERQRLVLFLRSYGDLDYATIAEALSTSSGTVGATLTTARAALGHALEVKEATP